MSDHEEAKGFDFAAHERSAIQAYLPVQSFYSDLASVIARIIEQCLKKRNIKVHSVQHRAKEPASLGHKASIPADDNPNAPKYPNPLRQITDLAGIRVITHFVATLAEIDALLGDEFEIVERSDKGEELIQEERFGYQSVHFLVRIKRDRTRLAEYERFAGTIAEVQVRTILQHAWAEIEHDIQYKSSNAIPTEIRRRFMALAGMLEIADREFQAIGDADKELETRAQQQVQRGELGGVEITPNALKLFLDAKLGPDARISDWLYDWTARLIKRLGFRDLRQVEEAIAPYDDDKLSRLATGARQGQTSRFELMLLAALGNRFIEGHGWGHHDWFKERRQESLRRFEAAGIKTGTYDLETNSQAAAHTAIAEQPTPVA